MNESASAWIGNALRKYRFQVRIFAFTFVAGFLVHFYMLTNKFYNYFEMNNILTPMSMDKGDTLAMGRWFLPAVSRLSSLYSMPAVNGIICLLCLSAVTCLTVDMLEIRKTVPAAFCGGIIVSFPGVASYLSYGVNADVFCVALLLSVLSAWVLYKSGLSVKGMVLSAVILCFCIAVYQPFMSVTIALIYGMLFLAVWKEGKGFREILRRALRCLAALAAGFLLYYVILKIVTSVLGISVGDYHGVNEIATFTPKGIAKGFIYTYFYFLYYLFSKEYTNFLLLSVFDGLAAVLFFYYTIRGYRLFRAGRVGNEGGQVDSEGAKGRLLCQILLILFLPIGINATPFLMGDRVGNGVDRYMMFSMMLLFVLLIKLMEEVTAAERGMSEGTVVKSRFFLQWAALICAAALIWGDAYMCNQGYFRAQAMTESEHALLNRLTYRLETDENWTPDTPVYFANCEALFNENYDTQAEAFTDLTRVDGTEIKPWYNYDAVVKYMVVYLNFPVVKPDEDTQAAILKSPEFAQMGIYPAADSIRMIGDVLVVKFNENPSEEE